MATVTIQSRVPDSPFLNQSWYVVFGITNSTVTDAFASVGSVVSRIALSGASYIAFYPAGSVATGTYDIRAFACWGGNQGTSVTGVKSITIRNSDIADVSQTVYLLIKNNLGTTYASTAVSTGWYSATAHRPQITVTRGSWDDMSWNLYDTQRKHVEQIFVDTWVGDITTGASIFGTTSRKQARTLLDEEVKRILNANNKAPSAKLRHLQILRSQYIDEIEEHRRVFRTRHVCRVIWDESLS